MATEAQILANRRNAQRSTGPRTQAGRARSCMNATKSGIYAKSEIIPGEDPEQFAQLTAEYYQSVQPQGREEAVFVDQLISADWQLRRLRHAEAGIYTKFMSGELNKTSSGWAYMKNSETLDRCYRNQAVISRNLRASLDFLLRLRRNGDLLQPSEQNEPNSTGGAGASAPPPGFCPAQSAPEPDPTPSEAAETNPIPGGAGASAPPPGFCPAQSGPEPDPIPSETTETNPIPAPPAPSPEPTLPADATAEPQPVPPDSRFRPIPGIHYTYNLKTGRIEHLSDDEAA